MTRAFLALPLPDRIVEGLEALQAHLPGGRLVDPENFHLTLAFLGEQTEDDLSELHALLEGFRAQSFELTLTGLGTFGGRAPRAMWVGVKPEPRLAELQKALLRTCRKAGLELAHRRFVPHVTLARFAQGTQENAPFTRFVAAHAAIQFPAFPVMRFGLYASHLGKGGAVHEEIAKYPLRTTQEV